MRNLLTPAKGSRALAVLIVCSVWILNAEDAAPKPDLDAIKKQFSGNVKVSFDDKFIIVESDGIPNHKTGEFPNEHNPNTIRKQNYKFKIPLYPKIADKPTNTPMGPIGVAINGIPFYNQYNREGGDAVKMEVFDSCCGHPDQAGRYHYHKYPTCIKSPFKDEAGKHSPLIGYAFDGFPIYGPNGEDGKPPTDLDECNGRSDPVRGYHYHVTTGYPYIIGKYKGVVERSNIMGPGGPGGGGPGGPGGGNRRPPPPGVSLLQLILSPIFPTPPPPPPGEGPPRRPE